MSEFEKELEKNMKLGKVAYERENIYSDFLVSKRDIERIFHDWQPPKPLVVVPQIIGDWIELIKQRNRNVLTLLDSDDMPCDVYDWLFIQEDDENINLILLAWLDGYTVEKLQLFYLKNKMKLEDVGSDLIGYLNLFLTNDGYLTSNINRAKKFTQQEIDSMQTGSYEKIPVEMSDNGI